jgi:hypothetical protein
MLRNPAKSALRHSSPTAHGQIEAVISVTGGMKMRRWKSNGLMRNSFEWLLYLSREG